MPPKVQVSAHLYSLTYATRYLPYALIDGDVNLHYLRYLMFDDLSGVKHSNVVQLGEEELDSKNKRSGKDGQA